MRKAINLVGKCDHYVYLEVGSLRGALTEEGVKYSQAVPFVITLLVISHHTRKGCSPVEMSYFYFLFCWNFFNMSGL